MISLSLFSTLFSLAVYLLNSFIQNAQDGRHSLSDRTEQVLMELDFAVFQKLMVGTGGCKSFVRDSQLWGLEGKQCPTHRGSWTTELSGGGINQ